MGYVFGLLKYGLFGFVLVIDKSITVYGFTYKSNFANQHLTLAATYAVFRKIPKK
jgi:hypothetical protein